LPLSIERIKERVRISYFSTFDRVTSESDNFCMDFSLTDYEKAARELKQYNHCSIAGENCELRARRNSGLEITLIQNGNNAFISIEGEGLPEIPEQ